jgi:hypothetical protein
VHWNDWTKSETLCKPGSRFKAMLLRKNRAKVSKRGPLLRSSLLLDDTAKRIDQTAFDDPCVEVKMHRVLDLYRYIALRPVETWFIKCPDRPGLCLLFLGERVVWMTNFQSQWPITVFKYHCLGLAIHLSQTPPFDLCACVSFQWLFVGPKVRWTSNGKVTAQLMHPHPSRGTSWRVKPRSVSPQQSKHELRRQY